MPADSPARRRIRWSIALPAVAVRPTSRLPSRLRYSDRTFLDRHLPTPLGARASRPHLHACRRDARAPSRRVVRGCRNHRLATLRAECLLNACAGEAFSFIWVFALPPLCPGTAGVPPALFWPKSAGNGNAGETPEVQGRE